MTPLTRTYILTYCAAVTITALALRFYLPTLWSLGMAMNVIAFCYMGIDKRAARMGRDRIPEAFFLFTACVGAGPGILVGGAVFRHKTRKASFNLPVFSLTVAYLALVYVLLRPA